MINATILRSVGLGQGRDTVSRDSELVHFELCPMCGQAVDRRDIHAVMHHLPVGHEPLPVH